MEFKVGDVVEIVADKDGCAETGDKGIVVDFDNNDPAFYDVKMTSGNVKGETKVFYERELKLISTELKAGDRVYVSDKDPECEGKDEVIFIAKIANDFLTTELDNESDVINRKLDSRFDHLESKLTSKIEAINK